MLCKFHKLELGLSAPYATQLSTVENCSLKLTTVKLGMEFNGPICQSFAGM